MGHSCSSDSACDGFIELKKQAAVVLAGGCSTRMGSDKALMDFKDGKSLANYVSGRLLAVFGDVYVSSKSDKFKDLDKSVKILLDDSELHSPLIALSSVLKRFKKPVFIQPVDMPNLSANSIKDMFRLSNDFEVVVACEGERDHNLCGFFSPSVAKKALELAKSGEHKVGALLSICDVIRVELGGKKEGVNLNSPKDLADA